MSFDLVFKNGQVILESGAVQTDLAVKDGKIVSIGEGLSGDKEVDATGLIVSPGMFDCHVHMTENGGGYRDEWEGYVTGTSACAKGGVTSFLEMPLNQVPATVNKESLEDKYASGQGKLKVDVYTFGGLVPYNIEDGGIQELDEGGATAYKCFMATCGDRSIEGDFQNVDDYSLYEGMKQIAETGKVLAIHAENAAITDRLGEKARMEGKSKLSDYVATRPVFTEVEPIQRAILLAKETGCRIHICHVACPEGIEAVLEGQRQGVDVTCETCLHYLYFTTDELDDIGNVAKCSPPIRDQRAQDGLWDHLFTGNIVSVISDHSPCTPDLKDKENAFDAWGGISGIQNGVDIFFDEAVNKRGMSLEQFANIIATEPCRRFGIDGEKGSLSIGKDADIVLIDPKAAYTLEAEDLEYRNKISPYIGREIGASIVSTYVRGHQVYSKDEGVTPDFVGEFK